MAASRFANEDIDKFIENNENQNTLRKTLAHVTLFHNFLKERYNEQREIQEIAPTELNRYTADFIINVRKADGKEYEPSYIRGLISSLDRKLKRHRYGKTIMSTYSEFEDTRQALRMKQRDLKAKGKGSGPQTAEPLTDDDINKLYESNQLGKATPSSLINTLWFLNTLHFGIRGGAEEHRQIRWGDIVLKRDPSTHEEYLEYYERTTKTRTGDDIRNTRSCPPRMYATPNNRDRCPVEIYAFYRAMRPQDYSNPDDPFYLAVVTNNKSPNLNEQWFLRGPIGKNKIESMMKTMAKNADLPSDRKLTNTSVRKTLVQKMTDNNVPDSLQVYVTGHKNAGSLNNYRTLNDSHKHAISSILSSNSSASAHFQRYPEVSFPIPASSSTLSLQPYHRNNPQHFPIQNETTGDITLSRPSEAPLPIRTSLPLSERNDIPALLQTQSNSRNSSENIVGGLFAGSTIQNCQIEVNIHHNASGPSVKRRRLIIDSDSE